MTRRLEDRLALVTGASRGIGAAIARAFAREGARVVLVSRKQEGLDPVAAEINARHPGAAIARACHVGRPEEIARLVSWVEEELGLPDILVNNAGTNPYFGPMIDIPPELYQKTFEVNLQGAFELTRALCRRWQAESRKGAVVSVASVAGISAAPLQGIYGMTKAALISMTKTLAVELGSLGIRLNAIAPGLIDTRLSAVLINTPEIARLYTDHTALKRHGQPTEIAELAVYLACAESAFVTGQTICVDGGYTIA